MNSTVHRLFDDRTMSSLRKIAKLVVPPPARHTLKVWFDPEYRERCEWERDRKLGKLAYESTGGVVVGGPFAGMQYVDSAMGSMLAPKLLGTYEQELAPLIEKIIQRGYRTIINIGAGEGYYAVGLAQRLPEARVICFEALDNNRPQIRTLSQLNGVADRVEIRGLCTAELLADTLVPGDDALIVCDVEGAEIEILDPRIAAGLSTAHLLVEMHDNDHEGISPEIRRRFAPTHAIEEIWSTPRTARDWPAGVAVDPKRRLACLDEGRGEPMSWFWMVTR
jgi:hypothetical protein